MCKYQFERGKVYYLAAVEKYQMKCYVTNDGFFRFFKDIILKSLAKTSWVIYLLFRNEETWKWLVHPAVCSAGESEQLWQSMSAVCQQSGSWHSPDLRTQPADVYTLQTLF